MAYQSVAETKVMPSTPTEVKSFSEWERQQQATRDQYLRDHGIAPDDPRFSGARVYKRQGAAPAPAPAPKRAPRPADDPAFKAYLVEVRGLVDQRRAMKIGRTAIIEGLRPHFERIARTLGADLHVVERSFLDKELTR